MTARRRSLFWRIHFWAALIASPFALLAALTGMLYVFTPQIEGVLYRSLDHVAPAARMRSLEQLVEASWIGAPDGWTVRSVVPPYAAGDSARVTTPSRTTSPPLGNLDGSSNGGGGVQAPAPWVSPPRASTARPTG